MIHPGLTAFVVDLHYTAPLEQVDALLGAHVAFLEKQYAAGHFVISGPKTPRTGGVIIALAESQTQLAGWLAEDPFHQQGVADYTITAFKPALHALALA